MKKSFWSIGQYVDIYNYNQQHPIVIVLLICYVKIKKSKLEKGLNYQAFFVKNVCSFEGNLFKFIKVKKLINRVNKIFLLCDYRVFI